MQFFIQVNTCYSAHTPYLPEVLQKGRGRPGRRWGRREGDRRGDEEEEEEGRGRLWVEMGIGRWNELGEGDREKVRILGDGEVRTMFIHEEGKREKMEGLLVMWMREDGWKEHERIINSQQWSHQHNITAAERMSTWSGLEEKTQRWSELKAESRCK